MIANRFPELQNTPQYQELQKDFTQRFALAALYVKKGDIQRAKEIIGEFGRIEEKQILVALLLQHKERFLEFIRYSVYGDVIKAYEIAKEDPRYQKLSLYKQIIQQIEKTLQRISEAIDHLEFSIEPILNEMMIYPKTKEMFFKLQEAKQLQDIIHNGSLDESFTFIEKCLTCKENILAVKLQQQWYETLQKSESLSLNGEFDLLLATLQNYLHVKSKTKQITHLLKKAARVKIQKQIDNNNFKEAEQNIYWYIETFEKDLLFEELMQEFEKKSKITLALTIQPKEDSCQQKSQLFTNT